MIIEDERDLNAPIEVVREAPPPEVEIAVDDNTHFQEFLTRYRQIKDKEAHFALRNALIDHERSTLIQMLKCISTIFSFSICVL